MIVETHCRASHIIIVPCISYSFKNPSETRVEIALRLRSLVSDGFF